MSGFRRPLYLSLALLASIGLAGCSAERKASRPPPSEPTTEAPKPAPPPSEPTARPPAAKKNGRPPEAANGGHQPPTFHVWDTLKAPGTERPGYGLYTYVLFGRRLGGEPPPDETVRERYARLLAAIVGSTPSASEGAALAREETNLFYIPARLAGAADRPSLANYDSGLALSYKESLTRVMRADPEAVVRLRSRAGPFLVSVPEPLPASSAAPASDSPVLYADLSDMNPAAMDEVVAAYKQRLSSATTPETGRFSSLRLTLLSLILDADSNVRLIRVAVADWQKWAAE